MWFLSNETWGHFTHKPKTMTIKLREPKKMPTSHPNTPPKLCSVVTDPQV